MMLPVILAGLVGVLGLGLWLHLFLCEGRRRDQHLKSEAQAGRRLQTLLEADGEGIAAFDGSGASFWGGGEKLMQAALAGPEKERFRLALAALWDKGQPFQF